MKPSFRQTIRYFLIFFLLSGCAAGTVKELQSHPAAILDENIDLNYQRVYKNVLDKMRECIGEGWAGAFAQYHIQNELLSDLKESHIGFMMSNAGMQSHYLQVDIFGLNENKSNMKVMVAIETWKPYLSKIDNWAKNKDATCN